MGPFEPFPAALGQLVEERDGFKLCECSVDDTFSKAKSGGDGIGCTKAGEGVKIMIMVDANSLPIAVNTGSATPHESTLFEPLFDFMVAVDFTERLIGDKAYDFDRIDARMEEIGVDTIGPVPLQPEAREQDPGRPRNSPFQASLDGRAHDLLAPELTVPVHSLGESDHDVSRLCKLDLCPSPHKIGWR